MIKNDDFDQYKYSGYGIGYDIHRSFSLPNGSRFDENVITFDGDMSSWVHIDILILGKNQTDGLDYTKLTAKKEYCINFTE